MGQKEIKEQMKKYLKANKNENKIFQNPWVAVLRRKFIGIQAYL